ncbi:hypothetical protein Y032_0436g1440 [Ancylostoma ceylanicum]|uniref:Uncharacterized protein n=1 Tax=Ancylostoma ceylanicum TaxID=53326 RepID=A0A016X1R1_9BILA|nr:hypothetical protein Y032_0436g1440 [Ancylostoma ceylanicum]
MKWQISSVKHYTVEVGGVTASLLLNVLLASAIAQACFAAQQRGTPKWTSNTGSSTPSGTKFHTHKSQVITSTHTTTRNLYELLYSEL